MVVDENSTNRYNGLNQLVEGVNGNQVSTYTYNAAGLRTGKTVNGVSTTFVPDGGNVALELKNGAVSARYVHGINLIGSNISGYENYYVYNAHGDVVQLTDQGGIVSGSYLYDAFGNLTGTPGSVELVNLALGKEVSVSSTEGSATPKEDAVDGSLSTRWASAHEDPQWIMVDLGDVCDVSGAKLVWERASAKSYQLQVSMDGNEWTDVYATTTSEGGVEEIAFATVSARYVRMYGTERNTDWGYSLFEFEVLGTVSDPTDPTDPTDPPELTLVAELNPFRYSGEYFDRETGTYYLRARYYQPVTGRFISEDSYRGTPSDSLSLNLYTYCYNNSILYSDPTGNGPVFSFLIHAGERFANKVLRIDTAGIGAKALMMDQDDGIYHASVNAWQQIGGYNDFYDWVFNESTSMASEKFDFSVGDRKFIFWAWKGDYINLGAGAELGIYSNQSGIMGKMNVTSPFDELWLVDTSLAMKMTMKLLDKKGNIIIDYSPNEKQWWITGFNPKFTNIFAGSFDRNYANTLTAIYTVTFNSKDMYNDFYNMYGDQQSDRYDPRWTFDPKTITGTLKF